MVLPIPLVDLGDKSPVTVVVGLLRSEVEDIFDALGQGLLLKADNEGGEPFVIAHSKIKEVLLGLCYSVKSAKLTQELLCKHLPVG
ncbi:hypothetical protein C0993_004223 [Termitomyces sp. T159_Od127]|nr:hypothetical protein C0993_004223 [Termitomyces sp. T159_Od127]